MRVALGADRLAIWWLAVRHGFGPFAIGCLIGGIASIWAGRSLQAFPFQLDGMDPGLSCGWWGA